MNLIYETTNDSVMRVAALKEAHSRGNVLICEPAASKIHLRIVMQNEFEVRKALLHLAENGYLDVRHYDVETT